MVAFIEIMTHIFSKKHAWKRNKYLSYNNLTFVGPIILVNSKVIGFPPFHVNCQSFYNCTKTYRF